MEELKAEKDDEKENNSKPEEPETLSQSEIAEETSGEENTKTEVNSNAESV